MANKPVVTSRRRRRVQIDLFEPSLTKQADASACDINNIMRRYEKTGVIDHLRSTSGRYGDFSSVVDYQTALNAVYTAQEMFSALPAKLRSRFHNDPAQFLSFVDDPANASELVSLGLVTPAAVGQSPSDSPNSASGPVSSPSAEGTATP